MKETTTFKSNMEKKAMTDEEYQKIKPEIDNLREEGGEYWDMMSKFCNENKIPITFAFINYGHPKDWIDGNPKMLE